MSDALEVILLQAMSSLMEKYSNTPKGGDESSFIGDLYVLWCELCYVIKISKTNYTLTKQSY